MSEAAAAAESSGGDTQTRRSESTAQHGESESEAVAAGTVGGDVAYEITRQRRGEHEIGPVAVEFTDVLGLFVRSTTVDVRDRLLVFPPVGRLSGAARAELRAACGSRAPRVEGDDAFDGLREYVRGDARRDIHWKTSAKRGELVVQEFVAEREAERVTVAAGTGTGGSDDSLGTHGSDIETVDAMAEAAATVCRALVDDGRSVTLATPSGEVEASPGSMRSLLEHLATAGGGPVPTVDADVVVRASAGSASVRFAGVERRFEALTGGAAERGVAASRSSGTTDPETDGTTDSGSAQTTGTDGPAEVA